jgi:hypothetical protein
VAQPITKGHMTNYDGWGKFDEDADDADDDYEWVEVSRLVHPTPCVCVCSPVHLHPLGTCLHAAPVRVSLAASRVVQLDRALRWT